MTVLRKAAKNLLLTLKIWSTTNDKLRQFILNTKNASQTICEKGNQQGKRFKGEGPCVLWDGQVDSGHLVQILGDSKLVISWLNGDYEVKNKFYRSSVSAVIDSRYENLRMNVFNVGSRFQQEWQHIFRGYNSNADALSHFALRRRWSKLGIAVNCLDTT